MRKFFDKLLFLFLFLIFCINSSLAINTILVVPLDDEVGSTTWRYVKSGLDDARRQEVSSVILHINTYGGSLEFADSIRTAILNYKKPVYAFIDNNAASAGALIAIACDSIFMRSGSSIGAATVVDGSGSELPDKYQSYMRSMIRSTAESHGKLLKNGDSTSVWFRDPLIAESMVDPRTVIHSIGDDSLRVVTFTAQEALKYGFCEGIVSSEKEIVSKYLHCDDCKIEQYNPTTWDAILGFLTNPAFQAILIMIIIGGIYFELQTPGVGFPLAAAVIAAALYFAPLYMSGMAQNWEILIFIGGIILLALEIFVIPGWGIAGISGILLIFASFFLAMIDNTLFSINGISDMDFYTALGTILIGIIFAVALVLYVSHKIGTKNGFMRQTALHLEQKIEDGYIGVPTDLNNYVGKQAVSLTVMRPGGKVKIDNKIIDAVSIDGFIDAGTRVMIVKYENTQLYVNPLSEEQ